MLLSSLCTVVQPQPTTLPLALLVSHHHQKPFPARRFLLRAASITSPGAADYPEELQSDAQKKRKKRQTVTTVEQEELLDPAELADPDSFFCEFNGVKIHHKICHQEVSIEEDEGGKSAVGGISKVGFPMILLHGFGASVFSWDKVMRPLARVTGSKVLAFDRPAFGLTSRISQFTQPGLGQNDTVPPNPYSMAFSVLATLSFIDMLAAERAIIMGHSAGCLVAVNTYFEAPERVAALILVAPAIIAPFASRKVKKENTQGDKDRKSNAEENPFLRVWKGFVRICTHVADLLIGMLRGMRNMLDTLYAKALSMVLHSSFAVLLIRRIMTSYGVRAIRNAWFDAKQVTDHVVQGYTKPLKAKGWEKALLEYTLAILTDATSKAKPPLSDRLAEISCPVLIITGDTDRLVPSWNSERLSQAIPGSTIEVIKNCGHVPHEEKADEFLGAVERFLHKVFGKPEELFAQATAY